MNYNNGINSSSNVPDDVEEKPKKRRSRRYKKRLKVRKIALGISSVLFVIVLIAGLALSFDFPARSSFSESEKRELAKFPEFSFSSLFNGSYFSGINLWFSDTFPFRDTLIKDASVIKSALGIGDTLYHFSEAKGDEIPEVESNTAQDIVDVSAQNAASGGQNDLMKPALPAGQNEAVTSGSDNGGGDALGQNLGSIYVYGNTGFEYYNFVQSTADKYISTVNSAADEAKANGINVYNMIIPTSIDIMLDESVRSKLNTDDQKKSISYMYSGMNSNVKTVQLYDLLTAHKNEYIYFRTDHHWTSLGAYYAYAQFMSVKGAKYEPLSNFNQYEFPGFLGTFYSDTEKAPALAKTPDTVYAYMPNYNISFKYKAKGASEYTDYPLICDATDFSESYKYLCFIAGDNPISVIENTSMTSGDSCILVKESFGNAFAPYLACNYKFVYVIDYRYYDGDITDFAKQNGVKDIIIQNNTSMTRNAKLVDTLGEKL